MSANQIITVNGKEIIVATIGNVKYVAIKPICTAIGVDSDNQIEKIKADEILGQLTTLRGVTGADGKIYKMTTLPLKYVFGWLFGISAKKVKPEIKADLIKYQKECYDALFDTFTKRTSILKEKTENQIQIEELESKLKETDGYKKIEKLKKEQTKITKRLNILDKNIVNDQLDLFKKE